MRWLVLLAAVAIVVLVILIATRGGGCGSDGQTGTTSTEPTTTTLATVQMTVAPAAETTPAALELSTGTYVNGEKVASYTRADSHRFRTGPTPTPLLRASSPSAVTTTATAPPTAPPR